MQYGRFFEIGKGILCDQLRFLAVAVAEDMMRYFMQYIRVEQAEEGLRAVASDGRRLHLVTKLAPKAAMEGIVPGAYAVMKKTGRSIWLVKIEEGAGDFPDYKRIFKEEPPTFEGKWRGMQKNTASLFELCYSFPEPTALNLRYLEDIGAEEWTVKWWAPSYGVLFEAKDRQAVIMPIDLKQENFVRQENKESA
jgi:hypothetical protein